ncbi:MAG: ribose-phosphate diphosphokinase [Polyangiales bacterium]
MPPRGWLGIRLGDRMSHFTVLTSSADDALAGSIARELDTELRVPMRRFPDGELGVDVGADVSGRVAVIVRSTEHPVGEHLLELALMADGCRRGGARAVVAVVPYMGYARQERRQGGGAALGMRVVADFLEVCRFDRIVTVDLHSPAVEGFFDVPIDHVLISAELADAVRSHLREGSVVVAPDLGALKRAREIAQLLQLPSAIVHKSRSSPTAVEADQIFGDVRDRHPVIVDDMISTGATIVAASNALLRHGCADDFVVAATHPVLSDGAVERLAGVRLRSLVVANTLALPPIDGFSCQVVDVAPRIARAITRI